MVSACITWYGATKSFFVNNKGLEVNAKRYKTHLEKELLPNIGDILALEKLNKRFVKYSEWPPTSPDYNPLDFYFWEKVQRKVYENRFNRAFENENALKRRIRRVWLEVSRGIEEIRKALKEFVPRLKSFNEKDGQCIKCCLVELENVFYVSEFIMVIHGFCVYYLNFYIVIKDFVFVK